MAEPAGDSPTVESVTADAAQANSDILALSQIQTQAALTGAIAGAQGAIADAIGGAADAAGEAVSDAGDRAAVQ